MSFIARRRIRRAIGRQRHAGRQRLPNFPLTQPVAAAALRQIEMDVVLVVPVRSRPEHRRKARADGHLHTFTQFDGEPTSVRRVAPDPGQDTEEVLLDLLGMSWEDIGELKEKQVIS